MTTEPPSAALRLEGTSLYLRPVRMEDATEEYAAWLNDSEVTRFMESRSGGHTVAGLSDYVAAMLKKPDTLFLAIVARAGDRHIGNIKLGPVDRHHGTADVALMIGDKESWGRGYASEAIHLVTEHAFAQMDVRKLTAGCYSGNIGSRRAFEKAGYHVEGIRRAQYVCNGEEQDGVLLARFRPGR